MELGFFMGLVTPPIHFGRVILHVWSSLFLVSLLGYFTVFYATCALGDTYAPLCFSQGYAVNTIRSIHHIFPRTLDLPLARVYQHTCVLDVEVTLICHGRRAWLSPRAMTRFPKMRT